MKNMAMNFYSMVSSNSNTVARIEGHMIRKNIDRVQFFNRIVENFFYGYLPFNVRTGLT